VSYLKVLTGLLAIAQLIYAQHTGYWRQVTPQRAENRICRVVENEDGLLSELRALKWDLRRFPAIDWDNDCAIVIAPSYHYDCCELSFFGINWDGNAREYRLNWGWINPDNAARSGNSVTFGSRSPGPEVVVISFKHGFHAANTFKCYEQPPQ
jgi:hypothetical protein